MKRLSYIDGLKSWRAVTGMKDPINIAINFAIMPLTNYMRNKLSGLLLKQTQ